MALISIRNLTLDRRLKSASLDLQHGEVVGLIGPNGAGKSTLLNCLAGIGQFEGAIQINGKAFDSYSSRHRAQLLALQPQSVNSAWSIRVSDVVELGRLPWGDRDKAAIQHAMQWAGVTDLAQRKVDQLSGGERARVWLARVLAGQPQALLVDEPIANLDIHYQVAVMDVLKSYAAEGHGVMIALHDLSLAARYCDRLCLLSQGELVALGTPHEVLDETLLADVYGVDVMVDLERDLPVVMARG